MEYPQIMSGLSTTFYMIYDRSMPQVRAAETRIKHKLFAAFLSAQYLAQSS